ncbi:putative RDD family membrane protein YckC [Streptomyces glaucescens]
MSAPTPAPGDDRPREGYYPDPSIPGYVRYWNGAAWVPGTSRPAPADGEPLAPPPGVRPAQPSVEETGPHFFDEDPLDEPAPQEPASAWGADRAHQSGFGGDQDRRVSWGTPQPADANADPRAAHEPADQTATPDPGGTFVFRRPTAADGGAETDSAGGTGRGGAPGQGAAQGHGAGAAGQAAGAGFGPVVAPGAAGSGAAGSGGAGSGAVGYGGAGSSAQAAGAAGSGAAGPRTAGPGAAAPGGAGTHADARAGARRDDGTMTFRAVGGPRAAASGPAAAAPASAADPASGAPGFGAGKAAAARAATAQAASTPSAPAASAAPAQTASAPPAQAGSAARPAPAGPQQQPAGAGFPPRAAQVPQQAAAPTPVTSGPGGGQSSWAQQVHQLAGGAGGDDQPVAPWKPPVEDVFQAAARRQAAARPAGFGKRLAARLIDTVVVAGVTAVAAVPLGGKALDHVQGKVDQAKLSGETVTVWLLDGTTSTYLGIVLAVLLVAGVLYEALPTAKWGRTLGKRLLGLEVRDIEAHEPPSFGAALRRWLVYSVPGLLCVGLIGVLWCLFDKPWRQCWHDKAARTFVAAD